MGREGEWRELGQRYRRPGIQGRDQLPQRLCTSGDECRCRPQSPSPPERGRSAQCPAPCPSSDATTARATACPIQKPPPASPRSQPWPPTTRSSLPPRILAATVPVPAIRAYPSSAAVPEWNMPSRSCSRTTSRIPSAASRPETCSSKGSGLLAGHRNQGQRRPLGAS